MRLSRALHGAARSLGLAVFSKQLVPYARGLEIQKTVEDRVAAGTLPDTLIILQHSHVYTVGKRTTLHNLLLTEEELKSRGIDLHRTERGGDVTYHGPGQVVAYPIVNLRQTGLGVRAFVEALEDVMIDVCAERGVAARGRLKDTGVWVEDRKVGQIGIRVSRGITSHGLSFNVDVDAAYFRGIVPCGIPDKEVTSLRREMERAGTEGGALDFESIAGRLADSFVRRLGYGDLMPVSVETLAADQKRVCQ